MGREKGGMLANSLRQAWNLLDPMGRLIKSVLAAKELPLGISTPGVKKYASGCPPRSRSHMRPKRLFPGDVGETSNVERAL